MDYSKFENPDMMMRPTNLWAIDHKITREESARQVADMIDVGYAGPFYFTFAGLLSEYMGEEWFDGLKEAISVAKAKNGYVWLYDEDTWPSGAASGKVPRTKDEYRAATLKVEFVSKGEVPLPDVSNEPKAAYILANRHGSVVDKIERIGIEEAEKCLDAERLIFRRHYGGKSFWGEEGGSQPPANLLNPEAVREFIRLTHEVHKKEIGSEFGGCVPGIFTDEPSISAGPGEIPWWDGIPDLYTKWHDRDFWTDLPWLFLDGGECRKVRMLVCRTLHRQFVEAYSKQIYEWCDKNNLQSTGHYLAEDHLDGPDQGQVRILSGSVMAHYRYEHIPGIDHLCRQIDGLPTQGSFDEEIPAGFIAMLLTMKQVGSAARQLGRKRVLTEFAGVTRHTQTFDDYKWMADYNLVLGANLFCNHLCWYSMRGHRKRDYPPNINYQQSYFKEVRPWNDYLARLSYALTRGVARPDVLVLHPIESVTATRRLGLDTPIPVRDSLHNRMLPEDLPAEDISDAKSCDSILRRILEATLNAGFDCDLGDEEYMEELGSVEQRLFLIGEMKYGVVMVPPALTWRNSTYGLLKEYAEAGGKLIFLGALPVEIDCTEAVDEWKKLAALPGVMVIPAGTRQIQDALDKTVPAAYSVRGVDGYAVPKLYLQHRVDGEQDIYFIVNSDRDRAHEYVLTIFNQTSIPAVKCNALDGTRIKLKPQTVGKDLRYSFKLLPSGSILIITGHGADDGAEQVEAPLSISTGNVIPLSNSWQFTRNEDNVLVMDRLRVSLDNGLTWSDEQLDFRIRNMLSEHFGTNVVQPYKPWIDIRDKTYEGKGGEIMLRYQFSSAIEHPENAYLVMEGISNGSITLNGSPVDLSDTGWQWDRGIERVDITNLVMKGLNVVDFKVKYDFLTEIEAAYIVGDFGVHLSSPYAGEIIDELSELTAGSWADQGYLFYSGAITYSTSIELPNDSKRTFLKLNRPSGTLFKIRVNGQDAGKILWRPYEIELTGTLVPGTNTIEIEVFSSRQNTHGPLHEREGDDNLWCGHDAFESESSIRDEYSLFNYGLLGGAEVVRV